MLANRAVAVRAGIALVLSVLSAGCARTEAVAGAERTGAVRQPFDSGAWKSGAAGARGQMAEDLIARGVLIGQTRAEVEALLGTPDQEGEAFLSYFVYSGANPAPAPAYAIRVEFDPRSEVVTDTRIDTDTGPEYAGTD